MTKSKNWSAIPRISVDCTSFHLHAVQLSQHYHLRKVDVCVMGAKAFNGRLILVQTLGVMLAPSSWWRKWKWHHLALRSKPSFPLLLPLLNETAGTLRGMISSALLKGNHCHLKYPYSKSSICQGLLSMIVFCENKNRPPGYFVTCKTRQGLLDFTYIHIYIHV